MKSVPRKFCVGQTEKLIFKGFSSKITALVFAFKTLENASNLGLSLTRIFKKLKILYLNFIDL